MTSALGYVVVDDSSLKATTNTDILLLQVIIGFYIIIIPVLMYFTFKYYKHRHAACMLPRRPMITIWMQILAILSCIHRIIRCTNAIYPSYQILRILFVSTYPILNHYILWLACIKFWLYYYEIRFASFCHGNEWKSHINPHNVTYFTNWYVLNRQTFGNQKYLLQRVLLIILIPICIATISPIFRYTAKYDIFINLFLFSIPLSLIAIIWYKTPKYFDYFQVREECRMLVIIGSILIITFLALSVSATFFIEPHQFFVVVLCTEVVYMVGILTACMHLTFWTLLKNKHRLNEYNQEQSSLYTLYRKLNMLISCRRLEHKLSSQVYNHQSDIYQTPGLLRSVIEHSHGFEMFLIHLLTELNLETALAIIEFTQYQALMRRLYNVQNVNVLRLPQFVPQSIIVHDPKKRENEFDVREIARKLFEKYIDNDAKFEINISYKLKKKLLADLENIDALSEEKIAHLFDECVGSLLLLLNDSLTRFVETEKYKQIEKELAVDKQMNVHAPRMQSIRTASVIKTNYAVESPTSCEMTAYSLCLEDKLNEDYINDDVDDDDEEVPLSPVISVQS